MLLLNFQKQPLFNQSKFSHSLSNTVSRAILLAQRVNLANLFDMIYAGIYKHNPVIRSSDLIHKLPTRWMEMQEGKEERGSGDINRWNALRAASAAAHAACQWPWQVLNVASTPFHTRVTCVSLSCCMPHNVATACCCRCYKCCCCCSTIFN